MRKLIFALTLGAILIPNYGYTLGLGEIEVNSSLNQKLTARIDLLSASPDEADTLIIKLASREEFVRAGLDRPMVLSSLKFKTSVENGRVYINVLSPKPIREPFLNFLIEVDWPQGHLIREYTILLDPPVFMGSRGAQNQASDSARPSMQNAARSAPVAVQSSAVTDGFRPGAAALSAPAAVAAAPEPVPVQQPARYKALAAPAKTVPAAPKKTTSVAPAYTPPAAPRYVAPKYVPPAGHRIQQGDTAWTIANNTKPESVSTQQMLIAMLRANPEVFIDGNVNGLKRGYILRTPDYADITAISHEEAKAAVIEQNALWREYQQSLASDRPASAVDEAYEETEYSSAVENKNDSRLSIVSAGGGSSASGKMKDPSEMTPAELREQLALAREKVETERVEKEDLMGQVDSLTTQVDKMKGLLSIKDDSLAEIQALGDKPDDKAPVEDFRDKKEQAEEVVEQKDDAEQALEALDALDELTGESAEITDDKALEAETEELFVDEKEAVEQTPEAQEAALQAAQDMLKQQEVERPQTQEATLVDILLDNRLIIGGLLVALLVLGAIGYLIKRRRNNASADVEAELELDSIASSEEVALEDIAGMVDEDSLDDLVSDEEIKAAVAETKAEEEFDADATMILPSGTDTVVTPAANLQPEEEQDDVMAEADVYLAYGIYQQAEELLEAAIKENPDKDNYRVKLAETYFAGKNAEAFAKLGAEMKQRLGDKETPAWSKVAAMGKELCPDEEIFQLAGGGADLDVNDLMPKSPEPMDFDLGDEAADDSALELDLDEDLGADLELPDMDETAVISPDDSASSVDELEFDLSETDAIEASPVEDSADEEEFSLDIEASELDLDMASDVTDESSGDEALDLDMTIDSDDAGLDMDLDMSVDSDDSGMDLGLDMSVDDGEIDLSEDAAGLDLSMDDISSPDVSMSMDDDLGDIDLSEPVDVDEINTKLDLAKAYLDMGDNEGARDILDEVLAGGNAEQKKEAEELMAQTN